MSSILKAGPLRYKVQILSPTPSRDAWGENRQIWAPITTVWASVQMMSGVLISLAQARAAAQTATHMITVRYNPLIVETQRVQMWRIASFDTLTSSAFDALDDSGFDGLVSFTTAGPPATYTIQSILDPDGMRRRMNLMCVVLKA